MTWRDRVDELLFAGESVRERVAVDGHELVVTTHRVLGFAPTDADGPRFRQVDRPNVADVRIETFDPLGRLVRAILLAAFGVGLAYVAVRFDFAGAIPDLDGGSPGMGAVAGTIEGLESMLAAFERVLLVLAALACLAAVAAFGWYLYGRHRRLAVAVVGDDDLTIPLPADPEAAVRTLASAIEGGQGETRRPIAPGDSRPAGAAPESTRSAGGASEPARSGSSASEDTRSSGADGADDGGAR